MPQTTDNGTGARISAYRRLHRLTQAGLAKKANISYSLLTKVESGARPATPALIAACARALDVSVNVLNGQPFATEHAQDRLDGPLSDLRAALDNWDTPLDDLPVRDLGEIDTDVRALVINRRAANFGQIMGAAPALIDELVQVSQTATGHQAEVAHHQLVQVYRAAHDVAYGLGLPDLVSLLLARMDYSAQRAGDPYLMALYRYMRAQTSFTTGRHDVGRRIIERAQAELADGVQARDTAALCAAGNLHLRASILATRQSDASAAREALEEARACARQLGGVEVVGAVNCGAHVMSFGPTNIAIHAAAVEVELGNFGKAVTLGKKVALPTGFPADRVGHHWIDMARAELWAGQHDKAMSSLLKARKASPQQAKYHPSVRETVASLVREARKTPETLIGYAAWVGVEL